MKLFATAESHWRNSKAFHCDIERSIEAVRYKKEKRPRNDVDT